MEKANLPLEKAIEPNEGAQQPLIQEGSTLSLEGNMTPKHTGQPLKKLITFADDTENETPSQKSSTYKEALSQPAPHMSHRARLAWLQQRRRRGLWAQCDECARWRFLPHVLDSYELPDKWYCRLNPDRSNADCSVPEAPIRVRDEEDMIHSEYSAGSVVWARMDGWPWWPAMVDDCPDTEQYYWLDGFSDIPTHYNVVFFDSTNVTRGWIAPEHLKPYAAYKNTFKPFLKDKKYKERLQAAVKQADDAVKQQLEERLEKYSFLATYKGNFITPKKVSKKELKKHQQYLKRKFHIQFEESESEGEMPESKSTRRNKNVIILGTHKSPRARGLSTGLEKDETDAATSEAEKTSEPKAKESEPVLVETEVLKTEPNTEVSTATSKKASSLAVQIGSTADSTMAEEPFDNDTSKTYVPETESQESTQSIQNCDTVSSRREFQVVIASPSSVLSDDFEY